MPVIWSVEHVCSVVMFEDRALLDCCTFSRSMLVQDCIVSCRSCGAAASVHLCALARCHLQAQLLLSQHRALWVHDTGLFESLALPE